LNVLFSYHEEQIMTNKSQKGEGDYEAARRYNKHSEDFIQNNPGKVDQAAKDARIAIDSPEGDVLEKAEREGKSHAKEEDLAITRP
jgi:Cdc6-like AAA superfamily ATPase